MNTSKEIEDLLEIIKQAPNANIPLLLEAAFQRGMKMGVEIAKKRAIEAIEQEK